MVNSVPEEVSIMGVVIPVGYGQMSMVFTCSGAPQPVMWTHGFRDDNPIPSPVTAAATWRAALTAAGRPYAAGNFSTGYIMVAVKATIMTATGPIIGEDPVNVAGTLAAGECPVNTAVLMQKATARGGRRGRGRAYLPPCNVSEVNIGPSGTIANAQLVALQALFTAAYVSIDATDYPPYLLHDFSEVPPDHVDAWTLQARVATQRTRMRK